MNAKPSRPFSLQAILVTEFANRKPKAIMLLHLYAALTVINTTVPTGGHQNESFNVITTVSIQISTMVSLNQCGVQSY